MSVPRHVTGVAGAGSHDVATDHHLSHTEHAESTPDTAGICPTDSDALVPRKETHKVDKQSTEYIIKTGIAGGLAGCAAKTVVGPLDRVKILFQASNPKFAKYTGSWFGVVTAMRDIHRSNGMRGLFRGHSATLLRIFPYAGIKFLAYEQVRAVIIRRPDQETAGRRFLSGALAGTLSVFFTYPLEVIRVRLAFDTKRDSRASLSKICRQIYNEHPRSPAAEPITSSTPLAARAVAATSSAMQAAVPRAGFANFYRGFTATLCGMLPYAGCSFLTHDAVRDLLRRPAFAPHTTLPPKQQPATVTTTTSSSSSPVAKPAPLKTWAQLLAGGLAGFVSQTASYPLEVVRRRMQVGGVVGDGRRLGMQEVARTIWAERGWRGFFVGLGIGYVKVVPMVATSFWVYERGKQYMGI